MWISYVVLVDAQEHDHVFPSSLHGGYGDIVIGIPTADLELRKGSWKQTLKVR